MLVKFMIGNSDFRRIREEGAYFVDKSRFIADVIHESSETIILPRPRRFGKTTNLQMLRCFFEKSPDDLAHLFRDLEVWKDPAVHAHFQQYPVIYLSLKSAKGNSWNACYAEIQTQIKRMVEPHRYLLQDPDFPSDVAEEFEQIRAITGRPTLYTNILLTLCERLAHHHRRRVVILIDEYDTPLHHAWMNGYFDAAVSFFQSFLGAGLKDNNSLYRGVVTGILRVSKENFFSDLNNITVYTFLQPQYKDCFGFTQPELVQILNQMGEPELLEPLRQMYNGYLFGGEDPIEIYNPWSIIRCLSHPTRKMTAYWMDTNANLLLKELLLRAGKSVNADLRSLLQGTSIDRDVTEKSGDARRPSQYDRIVEFSSVFWILTRPGDPLYSHVFDSAARAS